MYATTEFWSIYDKIFIFDVGDPRIKLIDDPLSTTEVLNENRDTDVLDNDDSNNDPADHNKSEDNNDSSYSGSDCDNVGEENKHVVSTHDITSGDSYVTDMNVYKHKNSPSLSSSSSSHDDSLFDLKDVVDNI